MQMQPAATQQLSEQQKAATTQAVRAAEKLVSQSEKELLTDLGSPEQVGEAAASITQQTLQSNPLPKEAVGPLLMFVVSDIVSLGVERGVLKADDAFVKAAGTAAAESFGSTDDSGLLE